MGTYVDPTLMRPRRPERVLTHVATGQLLLDDPDAVAFECGHCHRQFPVTRDEAERLYRARSRCRCGHCGSWGTLAGR